jgi:uncharacterized protein Yka (UPF0111/DUF47 family)
VPARGDGYRLAYALIPVPGVVAGGALDQLGSRLLAEYYDYEREERVRVSLAESTLEEQMLGLARMVDDAVRELGLVVERLLRGEREAVKSRYEKVRSIKDAAERAKDDALRYMAGLGLYLSHADMYRSIFIGLARLAMLVDGAAYRGLLIAENSDPSKLPPELADLVVFMAQQLRKQYESLVAAVRLLPTNPRRSGEEALKALKLEDEIDLMYRKASILVYKLLRDDIISLMLVRDLVDLLEETSDAVRDIAEGVRLLALYREARG